MFHLMDLGLSNRVCFTSRIIEVLSCTRHIGEASSLVGGLAFLQNNSDPRPHRSSLYNVPVRLLPLHLSLFV
jgi:hypothetical protein